MQSHFFFQKLLSDNQSPCVSSNVFIMYEDFETGKRAKSGLDYVAEQLGGVEFRQTLWRLDILQDPKLNFLAAPALADADLLIISLRGDGHVPAKVRVLIEKRLAEEADRDCALVVLFETTAATMRSSVYACLENLAQQHELDLFEEAVNKPEDQKEPVLKLVWMF
jgi:hypothetical protein